MCAEKKARGEIEELKSHIRKMQENERRERRKLAEEDAIRKIKKLEESTAELHRNLVAQKQVGNVHWQRLHVPILILMQK